MRFERINAQRFTSRPFNGLSGRIAAGGPVYIPSKPTVQRRKVSIGDPRHDCGIFSPCGGKDLGCGKGTERIARKVAESTGRPVNVLHATICIRVRFNAQQVLHAGTPGMWQVSNFQGAADQILFQTITQDDVQWIGDFVGINANEAGRYLMVNTQQIIRLARSVGICECLFDKR